MAAKKIAMVSMDWLRTKDPRVSLGHATVVAGMFYPRLCWPIKLIYLHVALQQKTIEVSSHCFNVAEVEDGDQFMNEIVTELEPHLKDTPYIGFGVFVWNDSYVQKTMKKVRDIGWKGSFVLGGPQISYATAGSLEGLYPTADVFIRGYAENALANFLCGEHDADDAVPRGVHMRGTRDKGLKAISDMANTASPFLEGNVKDSMSITVAKMLC